MTEYNVCVDRAFRWCVRSFDELFTQEGRDCVMRDFVTCQHQLSHCQAAVTGTLHTPPEP